MKQVVRAKSSTQVICNLFEANLVNKSMKQVMGCGLKVNELQLEERQKLFCELVYVHYNVLKKDASYLSRNSEIAEDLVQQVLLKAWVHLDKIVAAGDTALTLLRHMMKNAYFEYYKRQKKNPVCLSNFDSETAEFLFEKVLFENPRENYDFIYEEINKLPNDYKEVIYGFFFEGLKIKELASKLGVAEGTVKSNLHRAKKLLKSRLAWVL